MLVCLFVCFVCFLSPSLCFRPGSRVGSFCCSWGRLGTGGGRVPSSRCPSNGAMAMASVDGAAVACSEVHGGLSRLLTQAVENAGGQGSLQLLAAFAEARCLGLLSGPAARRQDYVSQQVGAWTRGSSRRCQGRNGCNLIRTVEALGDICHPLAWSSPGPPVLRA